MNARATVPIVLLFGRVSLEQMKGRFTRERKAEQWARPPLMWDGA